MTFIDPKAVNSLGRSIDNPFKTQAGADNLIKRESAWAESVGVVLIRVQVGPKAWLVDCVETDATKAERLAGLGNVEHDVVFIDGEGWQGRIVFESSERHPEVLERQARRWVHEFLPSCTFVRVEKRA